MELNFRSEKVTERITRIFAFNTELMYLVEGEHRALLIDTGCGYGDLRGYVDSLTDKPLSVVCSHGHVDHANGCGDFEEVWLSPLDMDVYSRHSDDDFRDSNSRELWPEYEGVSVEQIRPSHPAEKLHQLQDGQIFELGGISVEALACPGHTPGSMVILIPEERMIMLGDACNYMVFLFDPDASSVADYKASLQALLERSRARYDRVLLSHGDGWGVPDMVERVIEVCEDVLQGRSDCAPFGFKDQPGLMAKAVNPDRSRVDGGAGNIAYNPNKIW